MRWRRPHGTLIQATPDWFFDGMMGGSAGIGASVGNYSTIGLYNNATDGTILHVWGLHVWVQDVNSGGGLRFVQGTPTGIVGGTPGPLNPVLSVGWGQVWGTTPAAKTGLAIYNISGNNTPTDWYSTWPLATIPPTWSLVVDTVNTNVALHVGFMYCQMNALSGFY